DCDIERCAEGCDGAEEAQFLVLVADSKRYDDPIRIALCRFMNAILTSGVSAQFVVEVTERRITCCFELVTQAPEEMRTPFIEVDDPWSHAARMQAGAQHVGRWRE